MTARDIQGFDYRSQCARAQPMSAWQRDIDTVCAAGGVCRRIAGDLTAFDVSRQMLFEIYDQDRSRSHALNFN